MFEMSGLSFKLKTKNRSNKTWKENLRIIHRSINWKIFVDGLNSNKKFTEFSFLHLISLSIEMKPLLSVRMSELDEIEYY